MKLILTIFLLSLSFCSRDNLNSQQNKLVSKISCVKYDFDDLSEAIEYADCVKVLYLRNQGYKEVPEEIYQFNNLEELDLGVNLITKIENKIVKLKKLRELRISDNLLIRLPESLYKLEKLEVLWLLSNELEFLSNSICNLKNLKELNINGNQISNLPDCLLKLPNIESIHIESLTNKSNFSEEKITHLKSINSNCKIYY